MSEVRLVAREVDRDWSGNISRESFADRAIAALAAGPRFARGTFEAAVGRASSNPIRNAASSRIFLLVCAMSHMMRDWSLSIWQQG